MSTSHRPVTVVGIGADGWPGLAEGPRSLVLGAEVLMGSRRQLAGVPAGPERRVPWPSPLLPALAGLIEAHAQHRVCVLASGDPMLFGIGTTLVRLLGPERVAVAPHPSSASLACARLGWSVEDTEVLSLLNRPVELVRAVLAPRRRLLLLSAGADTATEVGRQLCEAGYGPSEVTVCERLGAADERVGPPTRADEPALHTPRDPLNLLAVTCRPEPGTPVYPRTPGLPDSAYDHDGQVTKREVRALTLARLAPLPGQLLWDVGAGSGSIGIEWMRAHHSARAVAVEPRADRRARIAANAAGLGVPALIVHAGTAPEALADLPAPDAVFIGGGATAPGVLDRCWQALRPGGRLVVNAVTLGAEAVLVEAHARLGGDLTKLQVSRAQPIGGHTTWRPALAVTQWVAWR